MVCSSVLRRCKWSENSGSKFSGCTHLINGDELSIVLNAFRSFCIAYRSIDIRVIEQIIAEVFKRRVSASIAQKPVPSKKPIVIIEDIGLSQIVHIRILCTFAVIESEIFTFLCQKGKKSGSNNHWFRIHLYLIGC